MITLLFIIIVLFLVGITIQILFCTFVGMAYGYWGVSVIGAPILWILLIISALIGAIGAIRNAFRAANIVYRKGGTV